MYTSNVIEHRVQYESGNKRPQDFWLVPKKKQKKLKKQNKSQNSDKFQDIGRR